MGVTLLLLAGCHSAPQAERPHENANSDAIGMADENRRVAEAALGKQAKIVAQGDLARNGLEQMFVVNQFATMPQANANREKFPAIFITRAVILEKSNGQWAEILRCDEHVKNRNGYLGGLPAGRVNGWRMEFNTETKQGLEIRFTPADEGAGMGGAANQTVVVRWNTRAKRYQSLDPSHQEYLSEAPTLETPYSILR